MKSAALIFPNQLFQNSEIFKKTENFFLIEHSLFFGEKKNISNFHKNKLILHRASMKNYFENKLSNYNSKYVDYEDCDLEIIFNKFKGVEKVYIYEPKDYLLEKRIKKICAHKDIELITIPNPSFVTPPEIYNSFFESHKYFMTPFYIEQRKRLGLFVDSKEKPEHGKWTFDSENRLKMPKNIVIPDIKIFGNNDYVTEAKKYVEKNFKNNLGISDNFIYPINHKEAILQLHNFFAERLNEFGPYEDAISQNTVFNFHSVISSSLNIGLLTPTEIIEELLEYTKSHKTNFSSVEGFLRQIIGWREFMMIVYERDGVKERNSNFFHHHRKLPHSFYDGSTGIKPFDDSIKKAYNYAYTHHIERLMILGNFMCLCEIEPNQIYKWFMEYYIDSYDWVMVPNVYGMSQYADGGLITTKPYISSSNYILKMSDYKKDEWCEVWDGLFWRFLHKNKAKIASNSRIGMLVKSTSFEKVKDKIKVADKFLDNL